MLDLPLYVGSREGGDPADPLENFHACEGCGQPVDRRDLAVVLHHEKPGHQRLPDRLAARLLSAEDFPRLAAFTGDLGHA